MLKRHPSIPEHLFSQCANVLCYNEACAERVKQDAQGRWFITMGHAGFNSPANNRNGYRTAKAAQAYSLWPRTRSPFDEGTVMFIVRKCGLFGSKYYDIYLQRDGSWGIYKTAKKFKTQDAADKAGLTAMPDGNYGIF
jgi:hypothetical protein